MKNPYESMVDTYAKNMPPENSELFEKWRTNMIRAALCMDAWEEGYSAADDEKP